MISEVWKDMDISLSPVRPMLSDSGNDSYNLSNVPPINECIYPLPESPVSISNIGNYRDRNILFVNIIPVKYVNSDMIKVCEKLIYRIDFKRSKNVFKSNSKIRHDVDTDLMGSLYTYSLSESKEDQLKVFGNGIWKTAPHYLILSIPDYSDSIELLENDALVDCKKVII